MHAFDAISTTQLREQADQMELAGKTLSEAAAKIREAADVLEILSSQHGSVSGISPQPGTTRKEQLREWLLAHGPMRRKDVLDRCGLPLGTSSVLLKEENGFTKDVEGRWYVLEDEEDD